MLLIDRILAAAHHWQRRHGLERDELELTQHLRNSTVYDVTNVLPLFGDWEDVVDKPIPKRSPHPVVWMEWATGTEWGQMRFGALLTEGTVSQAKAFRTRPGGFRITDGRQPLGWLDDGSDEDHCYVSTQWFMFEKPATPEIAVNYPAFEPCLVDVGGVFGFRRAGEYLGHSYVRFSQSSGYFGLPIQGTSNQTLDDYARGWFAPFMAFALLHCKNVITTDYVTPEAVQRKVRKSGNPPRVTFKTISLKVPETVGPRHPSAPDPDAKGSVRFHLCRGHFKNLTHPRFKDRGLHWWPAHWRGNPEAGVVVTDRELVPNTQTAEVSP